MLHNHYFLEVFLPMYLQIFYLINEKKNPIYTIIGAYMIIFKNQNDFTHSLKIHIKSSSEIGVLPDIFSQLAEIYRTSNGLLDLP